MTADTEGPAVAIVGMAGRFPGAESPAKYWENLRQGVESLSRLDDEALRRAGVPEARLGDPNLVKSGFVLPGFDHFDHGFFGFSPKDAAILDPQHRVFLETAWEALEDAGHPPERFAGSIGVYAGCGMNGYFMFNILTRPDLLDEVGLFLLRHTGNDKDFLATRVSYTLDLRGPSVGVQTACSTSLVAVHLAAQSLLAGECDMALAGGVTIEVPHGQGHLYQEGEILSPDGHCRAFDARSAGTVFGSGAGVVVLRRLEDALRDGDQIHAVIRGSAVNNDGAMKVGYLAPSVEGQAKVVAEAIAVAGVSPESIGYVETHGTGTAIGDPIEIAALTQAFRTGTDKTGFCAVGSVKPNIGHLDTAAGVASLIKAVKAVERGQIPPSLFYEAPNPNIDFASSPFFVNAQLRAWPAGPEPRRAGVTSLGVGGTNAHVIVEEPPARAASGASRPRQLFVLSARSDAAVGRACERLADHLRDQPEQPLADVAYTLAVGRRAFSHRRAIVAASREEAVRLLEVQADRADDKLRIAGVAPDDAPGVVFMFPGGGAQYPHMMAGLYAEEPVFRQALDACFAHLERRGIDLRRLMFPTGDAEAAARELARPLASILAVFSGSYALARLWLSLGVRPAAMTGHSLGEYVAACLADVMSLPDALDVVVQRGRIFEKLPKGAMLSVPLSEDELSPLLGPGLSIAVVNGPALCVASGTVEAIAALEATLAAREIDSQRVHIDVAAHSPMLDPHLAEFREVFARVRLSPPKIPFLSNRTGRFAEADEVTTPEYWVRHLRETVRFSDGLAELLREPRRLLVEVGPGKALSSLAKQHPARGAGHVVVAAGRHPNDAAPDGECLLRALGQAWAGGLAIDWQLFYAGQERRRVGLPTYPFERQRHFIEPGRSLAAPAAESGKTATETATATTERREDLSDWFYRPTWTPAPVPTGLLVSGGAALVVNDGDALSGALVSRIRARGLRVVEARPGDAPARVSDDLYQFRLDDPEGLRHVLGELDRQGAWPTAILHTLALGGRRDGEGHEELEARAFGSLLHLAQALGQAESSQPMGLLVVGAGFQQVAGEAVPHPENALLLGPARVIPRELPHVRCRSVDVQVPASGSWREAQLADALVSELAALSSGHATSHGTSHGTGHGTSPGAGDAESTVAYRGERRFVQGFEPVRLAAPTTPGVRDGGVYLVTGGLGGIGLEVARHLAGQARVRLALVGRTALPPRDEWDEILRAERGGKRARRIRRVQRLEAQGAEVLVLAADVASEPDMRRVAAEVRARFGRIDGVVHAAGVLDDALIGFKTIDGARAVLAPKVRGTLALDRALGDEPLDFFVLFSSVSGLAGAPGQVDYAAANAFLDAFAHARLARTGAWTCAVGWGAWRQIGMAAELVGGPADAPAGQALPTRHPFWESRSGGGDAEVFRTRFDVSRHWLLDEHRLGSGQALVPGAGYVELARAAFEETRSQGPVELRDVLFESPFFVPDGEPRELSLRLEGEGDDADFVITSRDGEGTHEHVTGTIAVGTAPPPAPLSPAAIEARCARREERFDGPIPQAHLRFGARWDNVRRIAYGDREALISLRLAPQFRDELPSMRLHPALLDMATAGAQQLIDGFDPARDFYVPVSYGRLRLFGALPAEASSHVRYRGPGEAGEGFAEFDVTVFDASGTIQLEVERFVMKRVESAGAVAVAPRARAAETHPRGAPRAADKPVSDAFRKVVAEGVSTAEGLAALDRVMGRIVGAQVVVSPRPLEALLETFRAQQPGGAAPAPKREPAVPVGEIEAALRAHEAIRESAAVAKEDRPGEIRILAYVCYHDGQSPTVSELRRYLRKALPEALVPANIVELDALPKDPAGRLLRGELPDPFAPEDAYVAPRTEMERTITGIYQEALGIERVGVHDNFFDIGGHSLLALRVVNKIAKLTGVRLNQPTIVLQTVEQIAAECERRSSGAAKGATTSATKGATNGATKGAEPAAGSAPVAAAPVPVAVAVGSPPAAARVADGPEERDGAPEESSLGSKLFRAVKQSIFKVET